MMIQAATKYGDVRKAATSGAQRSARPTVQTSRPANGTNKADRTNVKAPQIFIPTLTNQPAQLTDWFWRELREGGILQRYIAREKAMSAKRMRAVARRMHGVKLNHKSEHQLKACVPAREFFRWRDTDPDFWADDNNLRSWRRDNPDAVVKV